MAYLLQAWPHQPLLRPVVKMAVGDRGPFTLLQGRVEDDLLRLLQADGLERVPEGLACGGFCGDALPDTPTVNISDRKKIRLVASGPSWRRIARNSARFGRASFAERRTFPDDVAEHGLDLRLDSDHVTRHARGPGARWGCVDSCRRPHALRAPSRRVSPRRQMGAERTNARRLRDRCAPRFTAS